MTTLIQKKPSQSTLPTMAAIVAILGQTADCYLYRIAINRGKSSPPAFNPGQYLQVSVPGSGEAPISISGISDGMLELCVRRAGHVTNHLHRLAVGDELGIRGPFGLGFPVHEWQGKNLLLLAGGLGIAPIRSLLHFLLENRKNYGAINLMYGAREPSAILFRDELIRLSDREDLSILLTVDFAAERPPAGLTCRTGLLPTLLHAVRFPVENTVVALCGPPPLYRCVIPELQQFGFPPELIFISLERRMKCGVGHCCHCAIGDLFCCTDGPVFRYSDIRHIEGAL